MRDEALIRGPSPTTEEPVNLKSIATIAVVSLAVTVAYNRVSAGKPALRTAP